MGAIAKGYSSVGDVDMTKVFDLTNDGERRAQIVSVLATQNNLLVAIDFDGTIAGFSHNPAGAILDPVAREALRVFSELTNTHVVVISGRTLSDLAPKFPALDKIRLIGSHGHEYDSGQGQALTQAQADDLAAAIEILIGATSQWPGSTMERKSHAVAFHFRSTEQRPPDVELRQIRAALSNLGTGIVRDGNMVIEYCAVRTNRGDAIQLLRSELYPSMVLVMGDDRTDEDAFRALAPSDVSIKVGEGDTEAFYRVRDVEAAVALLNDVAVRRREWMESLPLCSIDRHIFLSDIFSSE